MVLQPANTLRDRLLTIRRHLHSSMSLLQHCTLLLTLLPILVSAQSDPDEDEDDDNWSLILGLVVVVVALALVAICLVVAICEIRAKKPIKPPQLKSVEVELYDIGVQTEPPEEPSTEVHVRPPPPSSESTVSIGQEPIAFGKILDGLYNLTEHSIAGRYSTVIHAAMVATPRDVVLKVYEQLDPCLHEYDFYTSFEIQEGTSTMVNEARRFIPDLVDAGQITLSDKSYPALVLQLGQFTLRDFLARRGVSREVVLSDKSSLFQICNCVRFLHRKGYAHGDLHTGSVMLFRSRWKLIDFSSWGNAEKDMICRSTSHYTAPEIIKAIARGHQTMPAAQEADIWSIGCIAFEILTKNPLMPTSEYSDQQLVEMSFGSTTFPWEGKPAQFWSEIKSPAAAKIVQSCLHRDPAKRWNIDRVIQYMQFWSE